MSKDKNLTALKSRQQPKKQKKLEVVKLFWEAILETIKPQNFIPYWIPTWSWMTFIFVLSSRSDINTGPFALAPFWHMGAFFFLAFLVYRTFRYYGFGVLDSYLVGAFWSLIYGILDEIHQIFVPGRDFSIFDMLTDLVGILIFGLLIRLISKFREKKE